MSKPDWIKLCAEHWSQRDWGLVTDEPCLICERNKLHKDYQYLVECHDILQGAYATDSTTIKELREEVRELEAEVEDRQGVEDSLTKWVSETESQLTKAKGALEKLADASNWFHAIEDGREYTAWRGDSEPDNIASEALTELEDKELSHNHSSSCIVTHGSKTITPESCLCGGSGIDSEGYSPGHVEMLPCPDCEDK